MPAHFRPPTNHLTPLTIPPLSPQVQAQVARSLAVKGELQRLEEQALEDRVRIQRLLALPQPLRGGDVTITLPADAARPFPLAAAAEGAGAGAGEWQGQQGEEEQGGSVMQAGAAVSVEGRARRRAEWVAQALRWERDPGVARLLREIQGAMQVGGPVCVYACERERWVVVGWWGGGR